ncbi:MAG: cytochrome c biogenesis protein CcsA [Verrucomicrobiales bacterium]|nr:cytochrome c biogenesis protein CcsA [Verrucomicrobiales bacterium]
MSAKVVNGGLFVVVLGLLAWVVAGLRAPANPGEFNTRDFGQLPVLVNGRVQPLDSVGANALLQIRTRRSVSFKEPQPDGGEARRRLGATDWLLEVFIKPEVADTRPVFRIDNPDLKDLLKLPGDESLHYFTFKELEGSLGEVQKQAERANGIEAQLRSLFEKNVVRLNQSLILYQRLKNSLQPESTHDFAGELAEYEGAMKAGMEAFRQSEAGEAHDEEALTNFARMAQRYDLLSRMAYPMLIPTPGGTGDNAGWRTVGEALLEPIHGGAWSPAVAAYAAMSTAYHNGDATEFNSALAGYRQWLTSNLADAVSKGRSEFLFNQWAPFYRSTVVYVVAFLLGCVSWFAWFKPFNRAALALLLLAFLVHTVGVVFRMALEGRPPVTNLYSSAVFVGWGTVLLGLILEKIFRNSIGIVMAAAVGFATQVIAHNLALGGDTMEMMRAVLDSNFWLTTHVITITIGYSAMFAAGVLGLLYIGLGVFSRIMDASTRKAIERMVYGTICFATLFSFVGTILGGIWADQSWGRFWGWDPKENGALLIVIWCAVILHAHWDGLVEGRGLMNLAIFGNIVTSFSWFGVNMLGVGLHSYGFMDAAFKWLVGFIVFNLAFIGLGLLPFAYWKSLRAPSSPPEPRVRGAKPAASRA